jgi:hypothetical protein
MCRRLLRCGCFWFVFVFRFGFFLQQYTGCRMQHKSAAESTLQALPKQRSTVFTQLTLRMLYAAQVSSAVHSTAVTETHNSSVQYAARSAPVYVMQHTAHCTPHDKWPICASGTAGWVTADVRATQNGEVQDDYDDDDGPVADESRSPISEGNSASAVVEVCYLYEIVPVSICGALLFLLDVFLVSQHKRTPTRVRAHAHMILCNHSKTSAFVVFVCLFLSVSKKVDLHLSESLSFLPSTLLFDLFFSNKKL